ncbi:MAG: Npun_F0296 family exosortase-dependent surface protein [Microcoleus sp.]
MTIVKKLSRLAIGATVWAGITNPVSAIMMSFGGTSVPRQGQFSSVPGAKTIDFESGAPTSGPVTYSAPGIGPTVVSGTINYVFWTPSNDYTKYLTVAPFGDWRGNNNVSISFADNIDYFGMYLGSFDSYNSIAFYQDNVLLKLLSGVNSSVNTYVNFFAEKNESFNKVVLVSSSPAFETDNHAYRIAEPVPEPTTVLGSLAFGAVVSSWRMKRKQQQKVVNSTVD